MMVQGKDTDMRSSLNKIVDHLQRVLAPPGSGLTDGQLLARFVDTRDEAAFTALVRRHGPMVWQLCQRVLGHAQDAEDAFQATFLVLARKAAAVVRRESVGSWLYAVAYRTALEARTAGARRRAREKQVENMPHPVVPPAEPADWRPWLDQELSRLPEHYRAVVVACDLEGLSRKEAARQLKLAEGTVSSRLTRGRCLLAQRLARHGLAIAGGALATALAEGAAAQPPALLLAATVQSALLVAAGEWAAVVPSVAILTRGVLKIMFLTKLKSVVGMVLAVTLLGTSGLVYHAAGQAPAAGQSGAKRLSEVEALRRENELLKLNLEVVLEKVRAQETELRALRGQNAAAAPLPLYQAHTPEQAAELSQWLANKRVMQYGTTTPQPGDKTTKPAEKTPPLVPDKGAAMQKDLQKLHQLQNPDGLRRKLEALENTIRQLRAELQELESKPEEMRKN